MKLVLPTWKRKQNISALCTLISELFLKAKGENEDGDQEKDRG